MSLLAALLAAAAALVLRPPAPARGRLPRVAPGPSVPADRKGRPPPWQYAAVAVAVAGVALAVGGLVGVVAGALAGAGLVILLRRGTVAVEEPAGRELALLLELLAAALEAGAPLELAVDAVSTALPGPSARALSIVMAHVRLGADAGRVVRLLGDSSLAAVGESLLRVGNSGAALAPALRRLAADARRDAQAQTVVAVRRLEVFVVVPLGLCFLPAFLLLGVVPVVVGLFPRGVF